MSTPVAHGTAVASISPRATSALGKAGIETLEDALERAKAAPDELLKLPGFGAASLVALVAWGAKAALEAQMATPGFVVVASPDHAELLARELLTIAVEANGGRLRPEDAEASWRVARRFRALAEGEE